MYKENQAFALAQRHSRNTKCCYLSLRKELVSLKEKFKNKTEETDAAWEAFEAAKKKLGGDYSRSSKDED